MTNKKEIKKIEQDTPGKARGTTFITDFYYIKQYKGQKGVKEVQEQINKWGIDLDYNQVKNNKWYPTGWRVISLLAIKKVFNWKDKDIFQMGQAAPKNSFVVKTLLKYFMSVERTFRETVKYWDKHFTVGELEDNYINIKNKIMILRISNFQGHLVLCQYLRGYFKTILELAVRKKNCEVKERKCAVQGDSYHEFELRW